MTPIPDRYGPYEPAQRKSGEWAIRRPLLADPRSGLLLADGKRKPILLKTRPAAEKRALRANQEIGLA
ncbi:hypothetical protein SEA_ALTADENA_45 [Arthrobacter phage Altadena]|uniref:Uncharacterized protein n=1 Tax=Arthrobacter phage Altadena TaxID=3059064 RepID=A0AA96HVC8_9CAUD|nr:hypothetical protein SEA_ALTADENA_45 [Arthrobacter phage Altadena]